jgi:hypothetical protein
MKINRKYQFLIKLLQISVDDMTDISLRQPL